MGTGPVEPCDIATALGIHRKLLTFGGIKLLSP
jgi:hypothetical protein